MYAVIVDKLLLTVYCKLLSNIVLSIIRSAMSKLT